MALSNATFSFAGGAVSDLFSGFQQSDALKLKAHGDLAEAQNYQLAAGYALDQEKYTEQSTAIKQVQQQRELYQSLGQTKAEVAGAGFAESGSALDILRESAQQGALTHAVIGQQGLIEEEGYREQATSYQNMAAAATYAANEENKQAGKAEMYGEISGAIKGVSAVASLFI